ADPDGDAVTLSVTDLPDGASFDAGTGEFSWTPSYDQAGLYSVTFYASNSLSASETITITVTDVGPTEQIQNLVDAVTEYRASGDIDNHGIMNSLISKLDAAKSQLDSGNTKAAANILQAFINHLEAQKGKHITDAAAQSLIDEALIILGQLQGESVQVQEESTYNDDEDDDDDDVKTKKPKKTKKR
ncbi:Ig domain-containing protein, partial [[Eubacterium] cellulosolvens]